MSFSEIKLCSPKYFTAELLNPIRFDNSLMQIPKKSVVLEISPFGTLQKNLNNLKNPVLSFPSVDQKYTSEFNAAFGAIGE